VTYVPDGDPCPKAGHDGLPTRITFVPGAGLFSQCERCLEDFLAWMHSSLKDVRVSATAAAGVGAAPGPDATRAVATGPQLRLL
jgi:hypothetical protein